LGKGFHNANDARLHAGTAWLWRRTLKLRLYGALLMKHKVVIGVSSISIPD
jgi:hypothetical protein